MVGKSNAALLGRSKNERNFRTRPRGRAALKPQTGGYMIKLNVAKYKLRAECVSDVNKLVAAISNIDPSPKLSFKITFGSAEGHRLPDCELVFVSSLTLAVVEGLLTKIENGHVMLETVGSVEDYTGDRRV